MELSVIIPTYNRADLICFTLDSLSQVRHEGVAYEVIVVDDGSTDNTKDVVSAGYPDVVLLSNNGKGAPTARNTGLAAAKGKYIMYLDSDDLVGEGYFAGKIAYLKVHAEVDACYGEYDFFMADGAFDKEQIVFKHKYPIIVEDDKSRTHLLHYLSGNFLPANSIIWRKVLLDRCGGHDVTLTINQDVDLFIRAIFNGLKIQGVNDGSKVYIRQHELDERVGSIANEKNKMLSILMLRRRIYEQMKQYGFDEAGAREAMSNYLFSFWRRLRHTEPEVATAFLNFAKEVYWPVHLKGNFGMLAKIVGPVNAVNLKYFFLKRD